MTKLKVGQKYRVIKDSINEERNGLIVTVDRTFNFNKMSFYDTEGRYFNEDDVLELIKDKKGVSKNPRQFRLLKDTPDIKSNTIFTLNKKTGEYFCEFSKIITINNVEETHTCCYDQEDVENNPEWFEEILEEPKKESKEIELPNKLITVNYCNGNTELHFEQELKDWIESVTKQVNKLSKEK